MSGAPAGRGDRLRAFSRRLVRAERAVSVVLLAVVVTCLAAQVIARYVFGSPISWSEEVARLGLIWLTFVASGFVTASGRHLTVDLLPARVSTGVRRRLDRLAGSIVLLTCVTLLVGGFRFVWRVWPVASPGIGVSMSFWYASASFGLALMTFHTAVRMWDSDAPVGPSELRDASTREPSRRGGETT